MGLQRMSQGSESVNASAEKYDVASLGITVGDIRARPVDRMPERGRTVLAEDMELHLGGLAAVTGATVARLGGRVCMLGAVGQDVIGDFALAELRSAGVDTGGVKRVSTAMTSVTMVLISSDGERSFIHYRGANNEFTESDVDFDLIASSRVFHHGGPFLMKKYDGVPAARMLERAQSAGCVTSVDTAWDSSGRWMELLGPSLKHVDFFFSSIDEAREIIGKHDPADMADVCIECGVKTAVIKMGPDGCYLKDRSGTELRMPAHNVPVVDTTGAGDAFVGGFLYGFTRGWDTEETLRFANAVGGLTCMRLGGAAAIGSVELVHAFMQGEM